MPHLMGSRPLGVSVSRMIPTGMAPAVVAALTAASLVLVIDSGWAESDDDAARAYSMGPKTTFSGR